jgi:hypothetical protein
VLVFHHYGDPRGVGGRQIESGVVEGLLKNGAMDPALEDMYLRSL